MPLNNFITLHLDFINLKNNKKKYRECLNKNCKKEACFNYKKYKELNIRQYIYVLNNKFDNMVDIKNKKCINCNNKIPNFNYENEKKALYCKDCKLENMIDIVNKKCINCNNKIPNFNYENEKKALYCKDCKFDNMINIINKKCISCNIKIPTYNYENEKIALYCRDCKLENMINIKDRRCKTHLCDIFVSNKKYKGYCLRCFIETYPRI